MTNIGVAVVGCGYWGLNHIRVFDELADSRVVAACDLRAERITEVKHRFPGLEATTDMAQVLARPDVDAVVVATQATSHYKIVNDCLDAGKHVLVEKPMTTSTAEAEALVAKAAARELKLMVGHTFLFNAGTRKVKSYVAEGQAGRVYYLYSRRTNLGPVRRDVSVVWDLAPHDVAVFNYLLESTPIWASAVASCALGNSHQDVAFVSLGYPDGVLGHIHVSWADPHKVRETVVVGSERRIAFDDLNTPEMVRVYEKGIKPAEPTTTTYGEFQFLMRDGDIIIPKIEASEPLKNQGQHFLDCILRNACPISDARSGLHVVRVMDAINQSIAAGGAPVSIGQTQMES